MISLIIALAKAALRWCDSGPQQFRADAVKATLAAPNQFTEQAVAFAIDQQMSEVTESALSDWIRGRAPVQSHKIGVISAGNVPFAGLQDLLAVLLCGHSYIGVLSRKSPFLLPAFVESIRDEGGMIEAEFTDRDTMWNEAEAVIATGSDAAIAQIRDQAAAGGIPPHWCLFRRNRYGVAVLDGKETEDDLENLALDVLLHEGMGCRNVALIFAPEGQEPDALLQHLAQMRGIFPAHPSTPGRLAMQRAYLEATSQPHAYGDGLEFLLSKGEAEPQIPGHVRWAEYKDFDEVDEIIRGLRSELQCIVAREAVCTMLPEGWNPQLPGTTQRPALDWRPDGTDTINFLCNLWEHGQNEASLPSS